MPRNWKEVGIDWVMGDVGKNEGDNDSDWVKLGTVPLPILVDIDAAIKAGLKDAILGGINAGSSWRVKAQAKGRAWLRTEKSKRMTIDALKESIFEMLKGARTQSATVITVTIRDLPGGGKYEGNDEMEYRQLIASALVDLGVPSENATAVALTYTW